jgi:hypothetical protein
MLFRLEQNPKREGELLGFAWIEVLAIEPFALGNPDEDYGEWCYKTIVNYYICNTNSGLTRISSEDIWTSIEELKEYILVPHKFNFN